MYDMVVDFFFNSASVFLFIMEVLEIIKICCRIGYVYIVAGIPKLSRQIDDEEERVYLLALGV